MSRQALRSGFQSKAIPGQRESGSFPPAALPRPAPGSPVPAQPTTCDITALGAKTKTWITNKSSSPSLPRNNLSTFSSTQRAAGLEWADPQEPCARWLTRSSRDCLGSHRRASRVLLGLQPRWQSRAGTWCHTRGPSGCTSSRHQQLLRVPVQAVTPVETSSLLSGCSG